MAEFVQRRLEAGIPDLLVLQELKLIEKNEMRIVISRRKQNEIKLERSKRRKKDILNCIKYELSLLKLISLRAKPKGLEANLKEVEKNWTVRIGRLFQDARTRFPNDIAVWNAEIEFYRQRRWYHIVHKIYAEMLKYHSKEPGVWIAAAKWQITFSKSIDIARPLLMRGLRFIPKCKDLYLELFKMELAYADSELQDNGILSLDGENHEAGDEKACKLPLVIYNSAAKEIPEFEFLRELLRACRNFKWTKRIQDEIYAALQTFGTEEALEEVAMRPLNDLADKISSVTDSSIENAENRCIAAFEDAIDTKPTSKMWERYIQFCCERLQRKRAEDEDIKWHSKLMNLFERAESASLLSPSCYVLWANLFTESDHAKCLDIYGRAAVCYPNDSQIWEQRITMSITMGSEEGYSKVDSYLDEVISNKAFQTCLPLWKLAFRWTTFRAPHNLESLVQVGMRNPVPVGDTVKVMYLEWVALQKGHMEARELYRQLWSAPPICKAIFFKMSEIEQASLRPKLKVLREIWDNACMVAGKENVDVWLEYIKIERTYTKDNWGNVAQIHSRATSTLKPELASEFQTCYNLVNTDVLKQRQS